MVDKRRVVDKKIWRWLYLVICMNYKIYKIKLASLSLDILWVRLTWLSWAACDANALPQYLHWKQMRMNISWLVF